jgi:hypothetical protein
MSAARTRTVLLIAAALSAVACQSPDVGQRCDIGVAGVTPTTIPSDLLQTFNPVCENLICIVSPVSDGAKYSDCPGGLCGYCSKPCVSDQDCFKSETGLECRQMVLDEAFIASLPADVRNQYLAGVTYSSYCAVPPKG